MAAGPKVEKSGMDRLTLTLFVGPVYEMSATRYSIDYMMVGFDSVTFHAPRGSQIGVLNDKRPAKKLRKVNGIIEERCRLYPSMDTLGRRDCVELLPVLSDLEKDTLESKEHLMVTEDASGNLLAMYGLHVVLEALNVDSQTQGTYRSSDRAALTDVKKVIQEALGHGLRFGMPMRATFVETR